MKRLMVQFLPLLVVLGLLSVAYAKPRGRGPIDISTRQNSIRDKLSYNPQSGQVDFPDELEFDFLLRGEDTTRSRSRSRKVSKVRPIPTYDSEGKEHTRSRENQQFYVDDNGSYQVSATVLSDGSMETELKALYRNGQGEKCFFTHGRNNCWKIDGDATLGTASINDNMKSELRANTTNVTKSRKKRQLVYTDFNPTRILKIVYVVDQTFIDWFRSLNPGDDAAAILDAEDYIYLLNNEANYQFRGVKEISEACGQIPDMDIVLYAQGFYYPNIGTDWAWLTPYVSSEGVINTDINGVGALSTMGRWVGNGAVERFGPFEHVAFFTTRRITRNVDFELYGIAFTGTVCYPEYRDYKASMNRDGPVDVTRIFVHELGHALSSNHDGIGGCPDQFYIMTYGFFEITPETMDTWNTWSRCSVAQIVSHIGDVEGCLADESVSNEEFFDNLCLGTRSGNQFDINYQCKTRYKTPNSDACSPSETVSSGKVPAIACWDDYHVQCTDEFDECTEQLYTIFDGTPCSGTNSSKEYVCFRGDCLEKVDVCGGRPTATPPSCSCAVLRGSLRTACCRSNQNADASCCYGCELNAANTECKADWTVTN